MCLREPRTERKSFHEKAERLKSRRWTRSHTEEKTAQPLPLSGKEDFFRGSASSWIFFKFVLQVYAQVKSSFKGGWGVCFVIAVVFQNNPFWLFGLLTSRKRCWQKSLTESKSCYASQTKSYAVTQSSAESSLMTPPHPSPAQWGSLCTSLKHTCAELLSLPRHAVPSRWPGALHLLNEENLLWWWNNIVIQWNML